MPPAERVYLQRVLGLGLDPTTENKEWLFVYGMPFALKSSVTQAVYKALGDYAAEFDISLLTKSRHGIASNAARPEIIALQDKRIIWTEEAPADFIIDDSRLKSLTSSGTKTTRDLFGTSEEIQLICSIVVESNGTFTLNVDDEWTRVATLERTRVVKFVNPMPPSERDPNALKLLRHDEQELSAALLFVTQGYFDRKDFGLVTPESIKDTTAEFQSAINPLDLFVREQIIFDDGTKDGALHAEVVTSNFELYTQFKDTMPPELTRQVSNARSFSIQFGKVAPYYANKAGVTIKKIPRGKLKLIHWRNVRLVETSDATTDENSDDDRRVQNSETGAKQSFGETYSRIVEIRNNFNQTALLHLLSIFPAYHVNESKTEKAINLDIDDGAEGKNRRVQNLETGANNVEEFISDLDDFVDSI